ncbi:MAG: hypothetical protein M3256_10865, partial [Actinomycetota bacterium]|nr:hypothetical protein [Actinomycetota bacterium]
VGGPGIGSLEQMIRLRPMRGGAGGGVVRTGPMGTEVRFGSGPREVHEVETVSFTRGGPSLEAALRLVAPSGTSPARLTGSVANRGSTALHHVRAQLRGGQATLADGLAPGESRPVDAPVIAFNPVHPDARLKPAAPQDVVAFAAASQAVTSPDQVALVATTEPTAARGSPTRGESRHITAVATVVPLESGSILPVGSGAARVVSASGTYDGESVTIFDLETIPGVGPLGVEYIGAVVAPGAQPPDRPTVEIYDWTTGRWRSVPSWKAAAPGQAYDPRLAVPLEPAELNHGLARVRTRTIGPSEIAPRLFLTGSQSGPGKS